MGAIIPNPPPRKLVIGLLFTDDDSYRAALRRIEQDFGEIDRRTTPLIFRWTDYYRDEMGPDIQRQWLSIGPLIPPDRLIKAKLHANRIEAWLTERHRPSGGRPVNLDPGLLDLSKLILASTKDFSHRVYLGQGIHAEITLRWRRKKGYEPAGDWTYRDYASDEACAFLADVRAVYKEQLEALTANAKD